MFDGLVDLIKGKFEGYHKKESLPRRIFGTENEFGFMPEKDGVVIENYTPDQQEEYLRAIIKDTPNYSNGSRFGANGGLIYRDCRHPEYASPETADVLDAIRYQKAGELILSRSFPHLYKNACDQFGNTFAAHVNFFTNVKRKRLRLLIPFVISSKIYNGSGSITSNGDFEISQRARFIERNIHDNTTKDRAIINMRDEKLSDVKGWHRFHCIENDPHMCESALGRDLGTMDLMLRLLEDEEKFGERLFPRVNYDENKALLDLHSLSRQTEDWRMEGVGRGFPKEAITLQETYLQTAWERYYGPDPIVNLVLEDWKDTLTKLRKRPEELFGSVDWITKREMLKVKAEIEKLPKDSWSLKSYDLEYHRVNREQSIFYADIESQGGSLRWVTDKEIESAVDNPPQNTRAYIRGNLVKFAKEHKLPYDISLGWEGYAIHNIKYNQYVPLNDPRLNYSRLLSRTKEKLLPEELS